MKWHFHEGETLQQDISGLLLKIPNITREQVYKYEQRNIEEALKKYLQGRLTSRKAPFDLPWIKKLHKEMFGDVWQWAGHFRTTNLNIGVPKEQIQMQCLQLLHDLKSWRESGMDFLEQSVLLHHRSVYIHPFENGNGRWGRLLTNIWLRLNKQPMILWPYTVDAVSPIREEYLAALRAADGMDYSLLRALHLTYQDH